MSDMSIQQETETPQNRPGQRLKAAREKLGLDQKEIASQLNLQVDTIDAVENDAADRLPAPTYVRGYLRSYARIVHEDADALIKLYENEAAGPPEIIPDIRQHHQISSTDKPVKAVTYLITFGLALLLVAWLQSHYVVEKDNREMKTSGSAIEETEQNYDYTRPSYETSGESGYDKPAVSGLSLYTDDQLPGPPVQPADSIDDKLIGEIGMPDSGAINTAISEVTGEPEATATDTPVFADDRIHFKITRDSWIEVHDSGNNRLYLGLAKSGEEIDINGVAPFNVLLGYSSGVEVTFNGNRFDPEPYSRAGIAKFTLGNPDPQVNTE